MAGPTDPSRPVTDREGAPYPEGWQWSLRRVRNADTNRDAVAEAIVIAQAAPRMMGDEYRAALAEVLMIRLGVS